MRELAQDIRRLMMLAYPGDRSDMSERLAKEHFICVLDDPELELKDREKEPQTLDSALKSAQRLQIFSNAVKQRLHTLLDRSRSHPIQGQTHSKREWQKSNKICVNHPLNLIVKLSCSAASKQKGIKRI